jgi:hypothetical protein
MLSLVFEQQRKELSKILPSQFQQEGTRAVDPEPVRHYHLLSSLSTVKIQSSPYCFKMFFGKWKQPLASPSSEEVSSDDWQHIPIDGEGAGNEDVPTLDPSFEIIDDEGFVSNLIEGNNSNNSEASASNNHTTPTVNTQREHLLMTMEALVQNGRAPNDKWTTYLCLLSIAALLFGVGGGGNNKVVQQVNEVPKAVAVEDLVPFPVYDAHVAMPRVNERVGEPVANPDIHFNGMKTHTDVQQQQQTSLSVTTPDIAAFVTAQRANTPPKHALRTKMGAEESSVSNNPRPSKPSAVPISKIHGNMKSRKRRSPLTDVNETSIPSVDEPRPPEIYPEHNDKLRSLEKRIEELEVYNEMLLERFVRTATNAADWKKRAATLDEALAALIEDRDALAEALETNKVVTNLSIPLDSMSRHSKKPMASVETTDQQMNATAATVSRRRDLRSSSAMPPGQGLVPVGPTALIPSPA